MKTPNSYADRITLAKMLLDLSDDALKLVAKPIQYAYHYTDEHDMGRMTEDDTKRLGLISAAVNETAGHVDLLDLMRRAFCSIDQEKMKKEAIA